MVVAPEDMDSNVYLTEAQKNLSIGNLKPALVCANKVKDKISNEKQTVIKDQTYYWSLQAVDSGGPEPANLLMRGRCYLQMGLLQQALEDSQKALKGDPSLIKGKIINWILIIKMLMVDFDFQLC